MEEKEINLMDYWKIVWLQKKFIIIVVLIFVVFAIVVSLLLPVIYKSTSVIILSQSIDRRGATFQSIASISGIGNMLNDNSDQLNFLAISKSRELLKKMNTKFDFQEKYKTKNLEFTYNALREHINVKVGEQNQIYISVFDKDQEMVADMANYFVESLNSLNIDLSSNKARFNRKFIKERLDIVNDSLLFFENKMIDFKKKNEIIAITEQLKSGVTQIANTQAKINAKEIELLLKKNYLSENNPVINALEKELNLLKAKYNSFFVDKANKLSINFNDFPDLQLEYTQLERKIIYFTKLLEFLGPQYEQVKIEEAKDIPTIQIIDKAVRPERRNSPKRKLIVIVISFIGFILSLIYLSLYSTIKKIDLTKKKILP